MFAIFTPAKQAPGHEGPPAQGEFSWHELATREQPAAFRFYETLFGWNKTNAMDMGPIGQYQMFGRNGVELGGMYNKTAEMPGPPAWTHYMMVDDIQRAADAAKAGGGQIINGPMEVPGGDWIFQALDPAGRDVRDAREGEEVGRLQYPATAGLKARRHVTSPLEPIEP